jgi:polyhydroxyalkanoate synthase
LLIIAAPIKRPYIWDLAPSASAVRLCLRNHLRVYLLEWMPPSRGDKSAGLADYAGRSIAEAVRRVSRETGGARPFLMGHSLGGTLAAIYGAYDSPSLRGLVLLASPLCFEPGSSRFRDALVSMAPPSVSDAEIVPGSLLSQLSAMASPETFVWSRWIDAGLSMSDRNACEVHARVERWALDEFPLPGPLVQEILQWLYRENRFCAGTLRIGDKIVGPSCLRIPTLGVINTADRVAPAGSIVPFVEGMPAGHATIIEHAGEVGVSLQHLAILIGREAHASAWPKIVSWLRAHT